MLLSSQISSRSIAAGLVALGCLMGAASSTWAEAASPSLAWPAVAETEAFLDKAKVVERVKIGTGITNSTRVTLELDGIRREAIFKSVDADNDSWRHEVAAYELDKLLGLGMVPPTVKRGLRGRQGCLQLWVAGVTMESYEGPPPDLTRWRRQVSLMWLFDELIGNLDRHLNNLLVTADHRLILIDNSKAFRPERALVYNLNRPRTATRARFWLTEYDPEALPYPVSYLPEAVARLRAPSDRTLAKAIGHWVRGSERFLVLERRRLILERIAELAAAPNEPRIDHAQPE